MGKSRFDLRTFALIALATLIGGLWAWYNLRLAGSARDLAVSNQLVWAVFATPFAAFLGWVLARRAESWRAAFVCFCIYFFAIFLAARVERLVLGEEVASATKHALYFQLVLAFDLLGCLGAALQRAISVGTIRMPNEPAAHSSSPQA
jgi:hypothetical protein